MNFLSAGFEPAPSACRVGGRPGVSGEPRGLLFCSLVGSSVIVSRPSCIGRYFAYTTLLAKTGAKGTLILADGSIAAKKMSAYQFRGFLVKS